MAQNPLFTLSHQDLRSGSVHQVPLHLQHPLLEPIARAIGRCEKEPASYVPIDGTPLCIHVQFMGAEDGNLAFYLDCDEALGEGKIAPRTVLYAATLSACEATVPLAWRFIFNGYLSRMLEAPFERNFNAPGPMKRTVPLLCGYPPMAANLMTKDEWVTVVTVARLAGVKLLKYARRGLAKAATRGVKRVPNGDLYIELKDWSS